RVEKDPGRRSRKRRRYDLAVMAHRPLVAYLTMTGGQPPVSASVNPCYWHDPNHLISTPSGWVTPSPHRALTVAEIRGIVENYRTAAQNAKRAGFDGIELHAANGSSGQQ